MENRFDISSIIIHTHTKRKSSFNSEIGIALALSFITRNFPLSRKVHSMVVTCNVIYPKKKRSMVEISKSFSDLTKSYEFNFYFQ